MTAVPNHLFPDCKVIVDGRCPAVDSLVYEGRPVYATIQSALDAAPAASEVPFVIGIRDGRYDEKLTIDKPFITFAGESRDGTVITYDCASGALKPDGTTYGTTGSAVVTVKAPRFSALNLTIENAFDYPANAARAEGDPARIEHPQAVALKTEEGSMQASFVQCTLLGYQDTLYANAGTQYYRQCRIAGHIDFIFGAGQAVFDDCDIVSMDLGNETDNGYITAASTSLSSPYGFLFTGCRLLKGSPALRDGTVALGRPWHPTTTQPDGTRAADPRAVASVLFKDCYMDSHITERGWTYMFGRNRDGEPIRFEPEDSMFYEHGCTGPGARSHPLRKTLTGRELAEYSIVNVLSGWNPEA